MAINRKPIAVLAAAARLGVPGCLWRRLHGGGGSTEEAEERRDARTT